MSESCKCTFVEDESENTSQSIVASAVNDDLVRYAAYLGELNDANRETLGHQ